MLNLWPFKCIFEVMKKERKKNRFFIFIILIYNIRLNYTILVLKSYSSQNILSRIGHDNQWMSVHHTYYQISYTSTSIFQTTQTSTVVEKKLKQLTRHMAYTLLTHIKKISTIIFWISIQQYIKIRSFKIMQPLCSKLPLQREKNSKRIHYIEVVTFEIPFQLNIKITRII